jgi:hypothetical protein
MIPVDWQFLGSLSFDFGSNREAFIPFTNLRTNVGAPAIVLAPKLSLIYREVVT